MTEAQVLVKLAERVRSDGSLRATAAAFGVAHSYLWDVLNGLSRPGQSVLDGLGLERITTYAPAKRRSARPSTRKPR